MNTADPLSEDTSFANAPAADLSQLQTLRQIIRETAAELDETGGVTECLKWGQLSWLPVRKGIGTTVRIDARKGGGTALYVHCQTRLIEDFRQLYDDRLQFEGNRAVLFNRGDALPEPEIRHCVSLALTYHLRRKQRGQ